MKEIIACLGSALLLSTGLGFAQESKFQVIQGDFTWQEAKEDAEARGGHLATVTSAEELDELGRFLTNYEIENDIRPRPWIGGFEAGSPLEWRWVTGEPFSYARWYIGLSTVNPPGDDELRLQFGSGGWEFYPTNRNGSRLPNYILEKPIVDAEDDSLDVIAVQSYSYVADPFWQFPDSNNSELTDGVIPTNTFGADITPAEYEPMVGFANQDAQIEFNLNDREKIDIIKIFADDADGRNSVYFPEFVEVSTPDGFFERIEIDDPNGAASMKEIKLSLDVITDQITLRIGHSREYVILGEIQFFTSILPVLQIIEGDFTWQEARADAETKGGRLAVLNTQKKIEAADSYLQEYYGENDFRAHIGLTDELAEDEYRWLSGELLTASNWASQESPALSGENYISWYRTSSQYGWSYHSNDKRHHYLLEILDQTPAAPFVVIEPLYESSSGEALTIDVSPTIGFPKEFTYQWCFNGFKIPSNLGGTDSSFQISGLPDNEGTWSVTVTNSEGSIEQVFEYRLYADSDSDGLSDGFEEVISLTDKNKPDTDSDGLSDSAEVNIYVTNPNSPDSDADGFTDLYEIETAYNPNSAESVPSALVNIMTAIEVNFNAALGATYAIEFSTDSQNWTVIEDDIIGEGAAVERLYSRKDYPVGFFRVERRDQ